MSPREIILGTQRVFIGEIPIDRVTMSEALDAIVKLARTEGGTVFTPNVDHVVLAKEHRAFRDAYARARLSLVDGAPVLWASRWLGRGAPEKISGSDLVPRLLERAERERMRVCFLGGAARRAARVVRAEHPRLEIFGEEPWIDLASWSPQEIASRVRGADVVCVALGAPKQELVADALAPLLRPAVLVGVGATVDFLAGAQRRAPAWMSRAGLEWLYRLAREPVRLAPRYLLRDPRFVWIFAEELAHELRHRRSLDI